MNALEIIISISGATITVLIGAVGYLINRQLQRVDDAVSQNTGEILSVKSTVIEHSGALKNLERMTSPSQKFNEHLQVQVRSIANDISQMKDANENLKNDFKKSFEKQNETDEIVSKIFAIIKKIVEKQNNESNHSATITKIK